MTQRDSLAAHPGDAGWHEPRWPASLALLVCAGLYMVLPARLIFGPRWLIPALEVIPVLTINAFHPRRHPEEARIARVATIALIAVLNFFNLASILSLVGELLNGHVKDGRELVYAAVLVWLTNVIVFALWFWELDRGGPGVRRTVHERLPDFLYPQMTDARWAPENWEPSFVDYLYLAFTNATAFSPTDAMPLTAWAKTLMAVESTASLVTVVVVAARAVNILQS